MNYPSIQPIQPVETPTVDSKEVSGEKVNETTSFEQTEKPLEMEAYIKELWKVGEAENHFEMKTLLKEINEFVLSEIERNKMESNRKSYEEIVQNYEKKLGLPDGVDVYTRTEKVLELMKIDIKLLQAIKEKEEILSKPITELTSAQLKKRLELNARSN